MCLRADWRLSVGRLMSAGGSAEVLGELPAGEGEDGLPAAIACVEGAPLLAVLARAVRPRQSTPLLLRALALTGGDVRCTAAIRRSDVSKCVGTAEVVLVTPVSLEGACVLPIEDE